MKTIKISGEKRTALGKKATKELRKKYHVPAVLYGGKENVHFSVLNKNLRGLVYTPKSYIVELDVDGQEYRAIMKDIQFHPVTDEILHVDFLQIFDDKPVTISIPVVLEGFAEGVKAGGKLYQLKRKLKVRALPKDLPDTLNINIDNLGLGKTIKVGELSFDNLELLDAKNDVVAAIKLTRAAKGAAAAQAAQES